MSETTEITIGRSPAATIPILDLQCSREQCIIIEEEGKRIISNLSKTVPTLVNNVAVEDPLALVHNDIIRFGDTELSFLEHERSPEQPSTPPSITSLAQQHTQIPVSTPFHRSDATILATPSDQTNSVEFEGAYPVTNDVIIGRDENKCDVLLSHPQVSRIHAKISNRNRRATIIDLSSANGTYVNGRQIESTQILKSGDLIDVGPFSLTFKDEQLVPRSRAEHVELSCHGLTRTVEDSSAEYPGSTITILDDVSLTLPPCEFICILGPSGSGKSTLLKALSGRVPAEEGAVTINGVDLYQNFQALKRDISVVPQKDVLHESLDVKSVLAYTAKLRLPPDTSDFEIESAVLSMIDTVGLRDRSTTKIHNLSGGQLKRASLANETISQPGLLFLDEVTSGLDEQTDAEMMQLFKNIAENGKTVVCITHSLAHVEDTCHRVVILTEGGVLAFVGSPQDALSYFDIQKLGQIYEKLSTKPAEFWRQQFLSFIEQDETTTEEPSVTNKTEEQLSAKPSFYDYRRQASVLFKRYLEIQKADSANLLLMIGQCCLVAILIVILFGSIAEFEEVSRAQNSTMILFLLAISTFWFGCNNSAKEIAKERIIYLRERDVNLLPPSYYLSKFSLLGLVSIVQTCILFYFVAFGTEVEVGSSQLFILACLSLTGVAMGLFVSTVSPTTDTAVTAIPLILIPQIIFSGAIAEVDGFAGFLASVLIVIYWAYGALVSSLPEDLVAHTTYVDWTPESGGIVIFLHMIAYIGAAIFFLNLIKPQEEIYQRILRTIGEQASKVRTRMRPVSTDREKS